MLTMMSFPALFFFSELRCIELIFDYTLFLSEAKQGFLPVLVVPVYSSHCTVIVTVIAHTKVSTQGFKNL